MGLSFGGTDQSSTGSSTSTPTYTSLQSGLQSALSGVLSSILPSLSSGAPTPGTAASEATNANTINQSYSALGQRLNKFLAARGFGQSGQSGQTQLSTELGREGALAGNIASGTAAQQNLIPGLLTDALQFAYANPGSTASGRSSGSSSGWGVSLGGATGGTTSGGLPWALGA